MQVWLPWKDFMDEGFYLLDKWRTSRSPILVLLPCEAYKKWKFLQVHKFWCKPWAYRVIIFLSVCAKCKCKFHVLLFQKHFLSLCRALYKVFQSTKGLNQGESGETASLEGFSTGKYSYIYLVYSTIYIDGGISWLVSNDCCYRVVS